MGIYLICKPCKYVMDADDLFKFCYMCGKKLVKVEATESSQALSG